MNYPGVVKKDRFDVNTVERLMQHDKVKELVESDADAGSFSKVPDRKSLFGDLWASLFKAAPELKDESECVGADYIGRKVMGSAMASDAYNQLRKFTVLDARASSMGCMEFAQNLEMPETVEKAMRDVDEAERALRSLMEQSDFDPARQDELAQALADAQQSLDQAVSESGMEMAGGIARAARAAAATAEAAHVAGKTLGWGMDAGDEMMVDPDAAMVLMERIANDATLAEILRLAGRLAPIALSTLRNRTRKASDMIVSVKQGNNLRRVLPHEFAAFADADRELDFLRRYAEAELMEYDMIGNAPEGKGPIIIAKDESSSMQGSPHVWASAICLAIAQACQKENRDFVVIHFGSESEIKVDRFNSGEKANLIEMATHFFNGGTSFERPLRECITQIGGLPKADVIFITDGAFKVEPSFEAEVQAKKSELGFRLITVGVNGTSVKSMEAVSDSAATLGVDADGAITLINTLLG